MKKPKDETNISQDIEDSAETFYMTMRNLATLAHAITGGIESPLQFCIQVHIYTLLNICSRIPSLIVLICSGT